MATLLVIQMLDKAIALRPRKRWLGRGYRLVTEQNRDKPNLTYIAVANQAAQWLARRTGGIAQSNILEALADIPTTAHVLGGAAGPLVKPMIRGHQLMHKLTRCGQ